MTPNADYGPGTETLRNWEDEVAARDEIAEDKAFFEGRVSPTSPDSPIIHQVVTRNTSSPECPNSQTQKTGSSCLSQPIASHFRDPSQLSIDKQDLNNDLTNVHDHLTTINVNLTKII